jgi:Flp pilus assembly protein TadG
MEMRRITGPVRTAAGRAGATLGRPFKRARQQWMRFCADTRGNLMVMLGFAAVGLVGCVGIAVDTSVAYNVRSKMAAAVDAAALAGARAWASPTRDADIQNFFSANFQAGYMGSVVEPVDIVVNNQDRTVTVTANATIPTFFMSVLGTDSIEIEASAQATLSSRDVEVALVLDVTGSMGNFNRINDLKAASHELIDIVVQDLQDPFRSRIAIVPYSNGVNVGSYADQVRGPITMGATCTSPGCETYRFENPSGDELEYDTTTCVAARTSPNVDTDTAPNVAPFPPNYPPDSTPGNPCPTVPIMPLSDNKTALHGVIDSLAVNGSTAGQTGIAWGWYMLAPNFSYLWPSANQPMNYSEIHLGQEVMKVVIIMTDGEFNTRYYNGVVAKDSGSGTGPTSWKIDHNSHNGSPYTQSEELCTAMKAEGVIVYTVGLSISGNAAVNNLMNVCATSPDHVFFPDSGTELKQAFRAIANEVAKLRISM